MPNPAKTAPPTLSVVPDSPAPIETAPANRSAVIQALMKEIRVEGLAQAHSYAARLRAMADEAQITASMKGAVPQGVLDLARRHAESFAAEALIIESILARIP
jgi:hypothetical protein